MLSLSRYDASTADQIFLAHMLSMNDIEPTQKVDFKLDVKNKQKHTQNLRTNKLTNIFLIDEKASR